MMLLYIYIYTARTCHFTMVYSILHYAVCIIKHCVCTRVLCFSDGVNCLQTVTEENIDWARSRVSMTSTLSGSQNFDLYADAVSQTLAWSEPIGWQHAMDHYYTLRGLSMGD
jgi:hypothetical protein